MRLPQCLSLVLLSALVVPVFGQSGTNDATFNPGDAGFGIGDGPDAPIRTSLEQPDGKILVGGQFELFDGFSRPGIARLNADGTMDETFDPGGGANEVLALALYPDGRVLIGGNFTTYDGVSRKRIARLNSDGSLDTTFDPGNGADDDVNALALLSDGRILVGGTFSHFNGTLIYGICGLLPDGAMDTSFSCTLGTNPFIKGIVLQSDDKAVIFGGFQSINSVPRRRIGRIEANGTLDPSFDPMGGTSGVINAVVRQPDGRFLVGGLFSTFASQTCQNLVRLHPDGSLDESTSSGMLPEDEVQALALQSDGSILVGGDFDYFQAVPRGHIARTTPVGDLEIGFGLGGGANAPVTNILVQSGGGILIAGDFSIVDGFGKPRWARLIPATGAFDVTFTPAGGANDEVFCMALQSDGKILIGGHFSAYAGEPRSMIARLNPDGSLDPTFIPPTVALEFLYGVGDIAIQPDGKILIGGIFYDFPGTGMDYLARLNADGSIDSTFAPLSGPEGGHVKDIEVLPDGRIIIVGSFVYYDGVVLYGIARLQPDGTLDGSFDPGSGVYSSFMLPNITAVAMQPDGKLVIVGEFIYYDGYTHEHVARVNADGSSDETFNSGDTICYCANDLAIQPDGKILVVAATTVDCGVHIVRFEPDGSVDPSFISGVRANSNVSTVTLQPDGKVLIGGPFTEFDDEPSAHLVRLNSDGTIDHSFEIGDGPQNSEAYCRVTSIELQPDDKILVGGDFLSYNGIGRNRLVRINNEFTTEVEDARRAEDAAVYPNPSSGVFLLPEVVDTGSSYAVVDGQGRTVKTGTFGKGTTLRHVDISGESKGIYMLRWSGAGKVHCERLILQ